MDREFVMRVVSSRLPLAERGAKEAGKTTSRVAVLFPALIVPFVAFLFRLYRLDAQSLWYDEALSVHYARLPWPELLRAVAQSDHPPLYFLALSAWMRLVGETEWAVRFFSAVGGVLTVPLTVALARALRVPGAWVAALGVAVSPFLIWYGQETRAYTWFTTAALASSWILVWALKTRRRAMWVLYTFAGAVLLYLHYYGVFVLAAHALYAAVISLSSPGRCQVRAFAVSAMGSVALFLPWAPRAFAQIFHNRTYWQGAFPASQALVIFFRSAATAPNMPEGAWQEATVLAFLGLVLMGSLLFLRLHGTYRLLVPLLLLVPLVGVLGIIWRVPKFAPRYLIVTLPFFFMLVGGALAAPKRAGWRLFALLLLGVWGAGAGRSLWHLYFDPQVARPDMRSVAAYISTHSEPGDAVLVVAGYNAFTFAYYNRGGLPVYALPEALLPDTSQPLDNAQVADTLNAIAARHTRLWLILWQEEVVDPQRLVVDQLVSNALRLPVERTFHGVSLLLFSLEGASFTATPPVEHPVGALFGSAIELVGYDLSKGGWARDVRQTKLRGGDEGDSNTLSFLPGETAYLALHWRLHEPVETDYVVSAQLLSPRNHIYGQLDRPVGGDFYPVSRWSVGRRVRQEHPVTVLPGTPPGTYTLVIVVYDPRTGERLPVWGPRGNPVGNALPLTPLRVPQATTRPEAVVDIKYHIGVESGGIRLLGYSPETESLFPATAWRFTLFWQRVSSLSDTDTPLLECRLQDETGRVMLVWQAPLVEGRYPPTAWPEGGVVRDVQDVFVPAEVPPGAYALAVRWEQTMPWVIMPGSVHVRPAP